MTAITDTIAGVLRDHGIEGPWIDQDADCICGEMVHDYDTHLAEAIAAAIEPEIRADECRLGVKPEWIKRQRERGWPDMHPEDYCHRCGAPNPSWCASSEDWQIATASWAKDTGREGICCLNCFAALYEQATGKRITWIPTPWRGSWEAHRADEHEKEQA